MNMNGESIFVLNVLMENEARGTLEQAVGVFNDGILADVLAMAQAVGIKPSPEKMAKAYGNVISAIETKLGVNEVCVKVEVIE